MFLDFLRFGLTTYTLKGRKVHIQRREKRRQTASCRSANGADSITDGFGTRSKNRQIWKAW
jgi:hypothetical protein